MGDYKLSQITQLVTITIRTTTIFFSTHNSSMHYIKIALSSTKMYSVVHSKVHSSCTFKS